MTSKDVRKGTDQHQSELAALIAQNTSMDGIHATEIGQLFLTRMSQATTPLPVVHEPALCIIAQGKKEVMLVDELYPYGPGQYLVVSLALPVVGQVVEATPTAPYLCLRLELDPAELSALLLEAEIDDDNSPPPSRALSLSPASPQLLDAAIRLMRLLETPQDIRVLAPSIKREILYRLLVGKHSECLRQIASGDRRLRAISRAINWLKHHYSEPFRIEEIAREVQMSSSALHHSFKTVTAMSPLQYQKRIRLQEARRLMIGHGMDAATASYRVGYESPSQFSREYKRLFGAPPFRDITQLKSSQKA